MDVVSPELINLLPDEIMDTEAIIAEEVPVSAAQPCDAAPVPMETDAPVTTVTAQNPQLCATLTPAPLRSGLPSQLTLVVSSASSSPSSTLAFKPMFATSTVTSTRTTASLAGASVPAGSGLQKLSPGSFAISAANHQIILNKVAEATKTSGMGVSASTAQVIKQDGQKLLVTTIGKSGQPIMLQLPQKSVLGQASGDGKSPAPQYKVVTIGGRTELKPVMGSPGSPLPVSALQAQQLKTLQIAKKAQVSSAAPIKYIITKTVSKGLTSQTTVSPVIAGRVLNSPVMSTKTISISESLNTSLHKKIAISPLKSPSKLTVVSVASQTPNATQKSMGVPVNMALGQQILTVHQPAAVSPSKGVSNQSAAQSLKPVQTVTMGGSHFKTIIPLATQPNVQQIQVPGSRFTYVRLVTSTTANPTTLQAGGPTTSTMQTAKPMVVNTGTVRMSVPIAPAQTMKQMVPKSITTTTQVMTNAQTQQRLIMPATSLPQIQPNFTNLPPGTVLAPAPGTGNVGYAVVPAQYVAQLQQSSLVTMASSSGFHTPTGVQTQARLPVNGLSTATDSSTRPRKPCNCTKSQCLKLYCDCFANGEFCNNCNCNNCFNNLEHETERLKAIKTCLDRNPGAFKPKIGKGKQGESDRRHSKGCNCKRSGCLKNYCECYEAKIMCSSICKCVGCKNFEESPERKTLMHLADAAEVRVQQQTAAKTKLSSQISDLLTRTTPISTSGGGRLPYTFVTKEVVEATCECLLDQARQTELSGQPQALAERLILEEFGHCLMRIISSAGKAKSDCINC
ncbi:protein lin-54 homolog [Gadus chalcogrammus]|uniref:protein lin-54 homolog n=1 Tax=Gadus chalcogrammus TaxID=1042646 RepID=UPI0024C49832|nr:protein lin-54 homolog [Gadus chalcogrammus]XP_056434601.1 protein lin-54 homolog [Gadus chalcogrammus]